jgi:hypothetical protein
MTSLKNKGHKILSEISGQNVAKIDYQLASLKDLQEDRHKWKTLAPKGVLRSVNQTNFSNLC